MNVFIKTLASFLVIVYPLVIYFGLNYYEPKYLVVFLCLILLLRYFLGNKLPLFSGRKQQVALAAVGLIIVLFTLLSNSDSGLRLYPVLVSLSLLIVFTYSLFYPPTVIERIARITEPNLSDSGVIYTRLVTKIWCAFFIFNGLIATYTTFFTSLEIWTLYNGLISYILMGSLFSCEFLYRKYRLKV